MKFLAEKVKVNVNFHFMNTYVTSALEVLDFVKEIVKSPIHHQKVILYLPNIISMLLMFFGVRIQRKSSN